MRGKRTGLAFIIAPICLFMACSDDSTKSGSSSPFERQKVIAEGNVSKYAEFLEENSPDSAKILLVDYLSATSGVSAAGISNDNITVWWRTDNDVEYCLITETKASLTDTTEGIMGIGPSAAGVDSPVNNLRIAGFPHNQDALILSPYQWDWNLFDFLPIQDETKFISDILTDAGYSTTFKFNDDKDDQNVSMQDFKDFDDYGVIAISSHGGVRQNGDVFIATGVIATQPLYDQYLDDLKNGNLTLVVFIDKWLTDDDILAFAITPGWISDYYPQKLDSTLFYASVCKGLFNNTMSNAIVGSGTAYFSWDHSVGILQATETGKDLFTQLVPMAMNCGQAYQRVCENGNCNFSPPFWSTEPDAHFQMTGDDQLRLVEEGARIAVTPPYYDDMRSLLESFGYSVSDIGLGDLSNPDVTSNYNIIVINCAAGLGYYAEQAASNLTEFVSNGGKLYASDWAFVFIEEAFPEYIDFPGDPYIGDDQTIMANVVDSDLAAYLGTEEVEIVYDLGSWVVIDAVGPSTNTLLTGDVVEYVGSPGFPPVHRKAECGKPINNVTVSRPLAVDFDYGSGLVIYTTFHNEAQVTNEARFILEYFVIF